MGQGAYVMAEAPAGVAAADLAGLEPLHAVDVGEDPVLEGEIVPLSRAG